LPPTGGAAGPRRAAWDRALAGVESGRLSELPRAFEALTQEAPDDGPAWFGLGLGRAWLGDNRAALAALDRYLELGADAARAEEAAALREVLRLGRGQEDAADFCEYAATEELREPAPVRDLLRDWSQAGRLLPLPVQEQGVFMAVVLELTTSGLITVGGPAA